MTTTSRSRRPTNRSVVVDSPRIQGSFHGEPAEVVQCDTETATIESCDAVNRRLSKTPLQTVRLHKETALSSRDISGLPCRWRTRSTPTIFNHQSPLTSVG